jgi:hypothetical protein
MSSVSFSTTGLAQFFQSVTQQSPSVSDPSVSTDSSSQQVQQSPHHHHKGGAEFKKIQSAVTEALQQAQSDPSADPNQIIESAIQKALESGSSPSTDADSTAAASTTTAPTTTDPAASDDQSSFSQTLQSLGVTPQQFHEDFLNAVKSAQAGNVDPSAAFQSFPPGSEVDTTA